jgi:hypothetical protein
VETKIKEDEVQKPNSGGLVRIILIPMLAILVAGGGIGYFGLLPVRLVGWALAITVPSAGLGGVVLAIVWRKWPDYLPQGIMAAMAVRMFLTLTGIFIFVLISENVGLKSVLYTVVLYIVGLICETVTAIRRLLAGTHHASA